ncbi:MAG TPA: alpha/beta hydrolase [Sporichthya sp.]|nr:alpha/beta hydrolase [Sporichthya sp.]
MTFVEVQPGLSIYAQDLGTGRPVVLIAGFGLNSEAWQGQVTALAAAGHRVVAVDLRGTGRSAKPLEGYGMDRLATDIAAVIEHLDLRRVTLVGWSFGAQISLHLAGLVPDRVAQLVWVGSNAVRASRSEQFPFGPEPGALEGRLVELERTRRVETRRRTIASAFHTEPDPDVIGWLLRMQLQMPSWAAIACYRTYLHTDQVAALAAVTVPVLQIMGTHDPVSPIQGTPWVQERLKDGRVVELNCGHYPMLELPGEFDAALLSFLAEVPA